MSKPSVMRLFHIRGVGGKGLCSQPSGAFAFGDMGKAIFAKAMGEAVCEACLSECGYQGSAAIALGRK